MLYFHSSGSEAGLQISPVDPVPYIYRCRCPPVPSKLQLQRSGVNQQVLRAAMRLPISGNTHCHPALSQLCDSRVLCPQSPGHYTLDCERTVTYDSGLTDPIVVRVDATLPGAVEGGSDATLFSPSVSERSWKRKKDKKKKKKR